LDWIAFALTIEELGLGEISKELPVEFAENEDFLKKMHELLLQTQIIEGSLQCRGCKREYGIKNGIPNMLLNEDEV